MLLFIGGLLGAGLSFTIMELPALAFGVYAPAAT
jgi:hypothetical protein